MAGVEGQGPFLPAALYQVSCRLLGCRMANMQPGSRPYAWLFFYWIRGVHAGQGRRGGGGPGDGGEGVQGRRGGGGPGDGGEGGPGGRGPPLPE